MLGLWTVTGLGLAGGLTATTDSFSVPAAAAVQDALTLIRERSPGARGPISLLKGKGKGKRALPSQRALAAVGAPEEALPAPLLSAGQPFLDAPELAFVSSGPLLAGLPAIGAGLLPGTAGGFAGLPVLVGGVGGIIGGGVGGGGVGGTPPPGTGGGGGGETPVTPPVVVTPPVSAVPEPSTWATMLLGFGAVGWSLRRRKDAGRRALHVV